MLIGPLPKIERTHRSISLFQISPPARLTSMAGRMTDLGMVKVLPPHGHFCFGDPTFMPTCGHKANELMVTLYLERSTIKIARN